MERKVQKAERETVYEKKKYRYQFNQLEYRIGNEQMFGEYCKIAKREVTTLWEEIRKKMKEKVNRLERHYKPWKREIQGRFKGILIGDLELEELDDNDKDRQ